MIRITAKRDGFRRLGIAHSTTPRDYSDGIWSEEQLAILEAETMLSVERLPDPQAEIEDLGVPEPKKRRR